MQIINKFSRGEIDDLLITREEVPKIQDSASLIENFELLRFGAMRYRNGTEHLGNATSSSYFVPFLYAIDDTADLEFTKTYFKPWVDDAPIKNNYLSTIGAIIDYSDATGTATISGSKVTLKNSNNEDGVGRVRIASTSNKYIQFTITDGSVRLLSDDVNTKLGVGVHKLKILSPTINIESLHSYESSVEIVPVPVGEVLFPISLTDPSSLRYDASSDIVYFAHSDGLFQIERRGKESWSLVETRIDNGVFGTINDSIIKLSVSELNGDAILTATRDYFNSSMVGLLFKLGSIGQSVEETTITDDIGTDSIRLTGAGDSRKISYSVIVDQPEGVSITSDTVVVGDIKTTTTTTTYPNGSVTTRVETFEFVPQDDDVSTTTTTTKDANDNIVSTSSSTTTGSLFSTSTGFTESSAEGTEIIVRLQRSQDESSWEDVEEIKTTRADTRVDDQDNSITFYRLYVGVGDNEQGNNISMSLSTKAGSIDGICRVKSYTDEQNVNVQIVSPMGGKDPTRDWYKSLWNKGSYPNVVNLYASRLHYAGLGKYWASLPDAFSSFDESLEGDSRAISKTIGFGASEKPNWLSSTNRLVMGIATNEISIRSDNFGTALTQANVNLVGGGNNGSAPIDSDKIDDDIIFVHRSLKKILAISHNIQSDKYEPDDFMSFNQEICEAGIKRIAVVREPETRVYVVLNNGEMRVLLYDKLENIRGWYRFVTAGTITDVIAQPAIGEDIVKIVVKRGSNYYYEKLSSSDSGNYVDSLGQDNVAYTAKYKSGKMGFISKHSVLTERVRIYDVGFIGKGFIRAIKYGYDFNNLRKFGERFKGKIESLDTDYDEHDHVQLDFAGKIETNSRVCLEATRSCTIMAITYDVEESKNPLKKDK